METISNLASGASKLIYGDNKDEQSGLEPVSGQAGAGTATDPYDHGNVQDTSGQLGGRSAQETHAGSFIPPKGQPHTTHAGAVLDPHVNEQSSGLTGGSSGLSGATSGLTGGTSGHTGGSSGLGGATSGLADATSGLTGGSSSHSHTGGSSGLTGGSAGLTGGSSGLGSTKTPDLTSSGPIGSTLGGDKTGPAHEHALGTGTSSNSASLGAASGGATGGIVDRSKGLGGDSTGNSGPDSSVESRESTTLSGGSTSAAGTTSVSGGASHGDNIAGVTRPDSGTHGGDARPSERDASGSHTGNVGGFGTAASSVSADPTSAAKPMDKQQGGDRPREAPTGEAAAAVKETKDAGEEALAKRDPNDHSGEPLKVHDGSENEDLRPSGNEGQQGGGEHGKQKGTGEQYVRTTGFRADGGDFDAAKPGAGREADHEAATPSSSSYSFALQAARRAAANVRHDVAGASAGLLDEKGVHHSAGAGGAGETGSPVPSEGASGTSGKEGKHGVGQKIKEKLHLGKH